MTPWEQLLQNNFNINFDLLIKIGLVVFLIGYNIFAFLVVKQVNLMTGVLGTNLSPVLKAFALLHLLAAVIILLIAIAS